MVAVSVAIGYLSSPTHTGAVSAEASAEASRATDSSIASRSNFTWQSWKPAVWPARARDLLGRVGQRQDRDPLPLRPPAHRGEQSGTAVGRKVQRRHDDVHRLLLQPANRLVQIGGLQDPVARHVQAAPDQASRERRGFGDQDPLAARGPARALKPIFRGRVE